MNNEKKPDTAPKSRLRVILIRSGVVLLLFLLTYSFFHSTVTSLISRIAITGIEDFPAVWQDWFMLVAVFFMLFIVHMGFTGIMYNFNLRLRRWPREE